MADFVKIQDKIYSLNSNVLLRIDKWRSDKHFYIQFTYLDGFKLDCKYDNELLRDDDFLKIEFRLTL